MPVIIYISHVHSNGFQLLFKKKIPLGGPEALPNYSSKTRADVASIGPVHARYWQLMACLQG